MRRLNEKRIITLVGKSHAKIGNLFIYRGPGSKCRECEYSKVCIGNVKPSRIYKIVRIRDRVLFCKQYGIDMQVVEVVNAEIPVAIPSIQAIPGAVITFKTPECDREECAYYELCFPEGLKSGDRCIVSDVTQSVPCPLGVPRKKVLLQLVS